MDARFIALEGIDGSGTTTQTVRLREAITARGARCVGTFEPTRGPVGSIIRLALNGRLLFSPPPSGAAGEESLYALLFAADRLDHLFNEIEPALRAGSFVVSDRYYLSSFAYQSLGCDLAWLRQLNSRCRRPDATFLLDADPRVCLDRIEHDRHGRDRYEDLKKLQAIRDNYLRIADVLRADGEEIVVVDGTHPIDRVHAEIVAGLKALHFIP